MPWIPLGDFRLIDSLTIPQLHSPMQPTQLSWLPVLSNVAPPSLRRKAATDSMLQIIEAALNWPVYTDVLEHPPPRLASRRPIWSDMTSVDTITQWREDCGQPHYCYRPYYPTARFRSPSSHVVTVSRQVKAHVVLTCTNGVSPNHLLVIVTTDQ